MVFFIIQSLYRHHKQLKLWWLPLRDLQKVPMPAAIQRGALAPLALTPSSGLLALVLPSVTDLE